MRKIAHVRELDKLAGLPQEVIAIARNAVEILDAEYGEERDEAKMYGGYVMILEKEEDLLEVQRVGIDLETVIPEYVDPVKCGSGEDFASLLVLTGTDFGVVLAMPWRWVNANLAVYVE